MTTGRAMNPPIPGHKLLCEGQPYVRSVDPMGEPRIFRGDPTTGWQSVSGGCECGAQPPGWSWTTPAAAVQRWHRQHTAVLRQDGGS